MFCQSGVESNWTKPTVPGVETIFNTRKVSIYVFDMLDYAVSDGHMGINLLIIMATIDIILYGVTDLAFRHPVVSPASFFF